MKDYLLPDRHFVDSKLMEGWVSEFYHRERYFAFAGSNRDDVIQRVHRAGRFFESDLLDRVRDLLVGGVCLDVGANIGNHSVYFGSFGAFEEIIAIEPNPAALDLLTFNIRLNGLTSRVRILNVALGKERSRASIMQVDVNNLGSAHITADQLGAVQVITGTEIATGSGRISFIKIDVEGHELDALSGLEMVIATDRPLLWVEVSLRYVTEFLKRMRLLGYDVASVLDRREYKFDFLFYPCEKAHELLRLLTNRI